MRIKEKGKDLGRTDLPNRVKTEVKNQTNVKTQRRVSTIVK